MDWTPNPLISGWLYLLRCECSWQYKVPVTSDLWPSKSNQFILESYWTFAPNLKTFPRGVPEISCSQGWDRPEDNQRTTRNPQKPPETSRNLQNLLSPARTHENTFSMEQLPSDSVFTAAQIMSPPVFGDYSLIDAHHCVLCPGCSEVMGTEAHGNCSTEGGAVICL